MNYRIEWLETTDRKPHVGAAIVRASSRKEAWQTLKHWRCKTIKHLATTDLAEQRIILIHYAAGVENSVATDA